MHLYFAVVPISLITKQNNPNNYSKLALTRDFSTTSEFLFIHSSVLNISTWLICLFL